MDQARQRLIVALDVSSFEQARAIVDTLGDAVSVYKVGFQLFTAVGPFVVRYLQAQGKQVFLDLKFHDIPNTVASGVSSAVGLSAAPHDPVDCSGARSGVFAPLFMVTVHTQGGADMMKAAAESARKRAVELGVARPLIVGVTVLTSDAGGGDVSARVLERARLAQLSGLDGVVASGQEAAMLRRELGASFVIVTPGIRPADAAAGDQKRVETPASAVRAGSSYLVVGRPIVQALDPRQAAINILEEMQAVL
jgi:orotidine-5'-phosphate decarboxylase